MYLGKSDNVIKRKKRFFNGGVHDQMSISMTTSDPMTKKFSLHFAKDTNSNKVPSPCCSYWGSLWNPPEPGGQNQSIEQNRDEDALITFGFPIVTVGSKVWFPWLYNDCLRIASFKQLCEENLFCRLLF